MLLRPLLVITRLDHVRDTDIGKSYTFFTLAVKLKTVERYDCNAYIDLIQTEHQCRRWNMIRWAEVILDPRTKDGNRLHPDGSGPGN